MIKKSFATNPDPRYGVSLPSGDIKVAASSFQAKIRKRLEQQSSSNAETQQKANDNRYQALQVMNSIRRAFNEIVGIDLGQRFCLELDIGDLNGWPRIDLCLIDTDFPDQPAERMIACVQNRSQDLFVELRSSGGKVSSTIDFNDQRRDLGLLVKKCIRLFLDEIETHILNPRATSITPLETEEEHTEQSGATAKLKETELFNEETSVGDANLLEAQPDNDLIINLDK